MGRVCSPLQEKWSHPETMSHVCAGSVENGASIDLKALIYLPRQQSLVCEGLAEQTTGYRISSALGEPEPTNDFSI